MGRPGGGVVMSGSSRTQGIRAPDALPPQFTGFWLAQSGDS